MSEKPQENISDKAKDLFGKIQAKVGEVADTAVPQAKNIAHEVMEKAQEAGGKAKVAVDNLVESPKVKEAVSNVTKTAKEVTDNIEKTAREVGSNIEARIKQASNNNK